MKKRVSVKEKMRRQRQSDESKAITRTLDDGKGGQINATYDKKLKGWVLS